MTTVIFSAPQGWGKTRRATEMRVRFGCRQVIDDWMPSMGITHDALHLTNTHPDDLRGLHLHVVELKTEGWK